MSYKTVRKALAEQAGNDGQDIGRDDLGRMYKCYFPGCSSKWSVWIEKGYCSLHHWGDNPNYRLMMARQSGLRSSAAEKIRAEIAAVGKKLPL